MGIARGPYRKAVPGKGRASKHRHLKALRSAAHNYAGAGEWVVMKERSDDSTLILRRIDESREAAKRALLDQADAVGLVERLRALSFFLFLTFR